ncbi:putative sporulation protein YtxC [Clostridium chauvoei]|uniref:putative sporulation protein YtxC n=1 Tax=Clostridium chauvoei TaxID=46867 RepID=UPI001C861C4C|nr:putative sporulation protein YtxC [Clostridium chauvoei]MBX7309723.1 putative sporulation protein YtxC [Clostridium chauvoei]MBX7314637.1 putative sporulation protein YtxC [Clostridium chauvoei]MBX7342617.1 putative sporulation protein YtxC [Clostridium chauvoei]
MILLKLVYNDDLDFIREIQDLRAILKKKDVTIGVVESVQVNTHIVKILCDDHDYSDKVKNIINLYISNILYRIVIEKYKEREMFDFLIDNYFFLKQEELLEVENQIMKVLLCEESINDENLVYCMNKMNSVIEKIKDCLEENLEINIDGFITFRMKELRGDIEEIIDKVIENYMVEKEYKEFVKLLKYFVEIQESKLEEVNIFVKEGGGYSITDHFGNNIFDEFLKELSECKIDTDAKMEDIIISGLITNAPKRIIIHKKENCINKEFLETIVNVFTDRVRYCDGCNICSVEKIKF